MAFIEMNFASGGSDGLKVETIISINNIGASATSATLSNCKKGKGIIIASGFSSSSYSDSTQYGNITSMTNGTYEKIGYYDSLIASKYNRNQVYNVNILSDGSVTVTFSKAHPDYVALLQ